MEQISRDVREMYERYPYPTRARGDMYDSFPELCLSYREGYRRRAALQILDAGCGTGSASLGTAICNPSAWITSADFNREALRTLEEEAAAAGVQNLRVCETDLNTLGGLPVPEGGYDVILCGGVIHHLADPARGLLNLRGVLAPHGVMRLMVYNTLGRQALYRFIKALNLIHKEPQELSQRLSLGRRLLASVKQGPLTEAPWHNGGLVDDVEFVDRYLNLNDTSYSVLQFMQLIRDCGLEFLRWNEPEAWELSRYLDDPELLAQLAGESREVQFELVEHLSNQVMLDCYVAHQGSRVATPGRLDGGELLSLNPQVVLQVCQESRGGRSFQVSPRAFVRARPSVALSDDDHAMLLKLAEAPTPVAVLLEQGQPLERLQRLLEHELAYAFFPAEAAS